MCVYIYIYIYICIYKFITRGPLNSRPLQIPLKQTQYIDGEDYYHYFYYYHYYDYYDECYIMIYVLYHYCHYYDHCHDYHDYHDYHYYHYILRPQEIWASVVRRGFRVQAFGFRYHFLFNEILLLLLLLLLMIMIIIMYSAGHLGQRRAGHDRRVADHGVPDRLLQPEEAGHPDTSISINIFKADTSMISSYGHLQILQPEEAGRPDTTSMI